MFYVLNIMPFNLMIKSLIFISAAFSIFYFILSLFELVHIYYNHFRPNYDWQQESLTDNIDDEYEDKKPSHSLAVWTGFYLIAVFLLIIVIPMFSL